MFLDGFLLLKSQCYIFLFRCYDVWIFHRLDVLTFRCFCLSVFSHGPSKEFIFDSTTVEAKLSCLFIICLWGQVKFPSFNGHLLAPGQV